MTRTSIRVRDAGASAPEVLVQELIDTLSGLVWDLTVSALALTLWVLIEVVRGRNWWGLLAIPATFCIGVSCGLPLYLALRR